ncbi:siderophore ABC transporter substrate-binding protein [Reinekea blandensis]|uniref:Periplasmic binding protein n=1 Tax=Reinekea blandensis MED297 TaxID=314283 RepID=A4BFY0_9GAMM|nr:ABC transporter substrate-binding protein [Reinekea blandensis]EAR08998.1 Periplasmic binding protein [Reinekea sp. MED297] [Reinekea blandensis MED297]
MNAALKTLLATATLTVAGSTLADTFTDAQGTVTIDGTPNTIVTFDLAPLDTFDTLGVKVTGVTKPHALGYLSKFKGDDYTDVGSFFEPDVETTASLEPDLIVLGPRSAKFKDQFDEFAPTFDASVWGADFLDQFYSMTTELAAVVGKEAEAEEHLDAIRAKVSDVNVAAADAGNALFILTSGGKISAYGPGSRFGWFYDELGVQPAVQDVEAATHGEPISFEFLKDVNPDWLFVLDRDAAIGQSSGAAKALLDNDIINSMPAAQNDRIVYVDGVAWYMVAFGLTAVDTAVTEVRDALVQ